ncbi:hypothetical protein A3A54_02510 [Candidatus Curtissbacteria bacterium RIFCSPLOWO2_01_FULL_39_62]|uniref:Uncharacterized protein n=2 Tax=Candidatus Curtissiibacteriota TaxID=1752717 RepID=A0A1F5G850_9BACT|nr:MAG: hypothetical protein A2775_01430 [Candidatus Curtissbacteria bacterium RIFCSPHIGHO2_01_FULL_39_57]OGD87994.1 MAG: hypothetical protein A3D04_02940 [Candidatus Curtissbacteria bacterium RIFCSPHIGHO2_02_FULL_40_16b]OGD90196.1 MAG: hypothetical protein A3E11_00565 [Candidatus Curtissbacteria bacterium RIFCSPHIGHO2_12_FULL_38_37]OGE00784.1 MAG: hypothetical protein A3J17_02195 [Candidatus Curtissbacteria bacterium RIFCSPLOWO2_02_FULL_40_11]OGE02292.1 MAG: hypothetical protein A3A54_02510 [C
MSLIEKGRQQLREQEMVRSHSREIFEVGIKLLRAKGQLESGVLFFKQQILTHTVNSLVVVGGKFRQGKSAKNANPRRRQTFQSDEKKEKRFRNFQRRAYVYKF